MRLIIFTLLFLVSSLAQSASPVDVVNERMKAHNSHDMEKFLATYSEEIQIYDYPNTPLGTPGKEHLRNIFSPLFEKKSVHTKIHSQMENANIVINRETVTTDGKEREYISIYEVEDGLIKSVRFIK